ncbi:MAG: DNA translocase FtsK 4TM domain-containing protein [Patescibacteria group bacterium]|nr:DNA translocase FtsK 4TM domain-containing protein [Patescibacteria group bacterium]
MVRRRRKANSLDYVRLPKVDLDPEMKRGIFIILILAFGAISLLSLFGLAEGLGSYLEKTIIFLFGWDKWLFPLFLFAIGFLMYNRDKNWVRGANFLGVFIFVLFFGALLHTFVGAANWQAAVSQGAGGGYIGYGILSVFYKIMGFWASLIVIVCLILIALMLMFNATLESIIGRESWFAKLLYPINFIFNKIFGGGQAEEALADEPEDGEFDEPELAEEEGEGASAKAGETGFHKHKIKAGADDSEEGETEETKVKDSGSPRSAGEAGWQPSFIKIDLPLDLLNPKIGRPTSGDIKNNMQIIQRTLENFGIPVEMGEINVGPTVTQYTLKPAEGIKLTRITTLSNDLALSLAAHPIRIEAPIPGRSLVGVEVPNQTKAIVGLREVLSGEMYKNRKTNTMVALGKDVAGKVWLDDLAKMPHLLVAGATNSGKSVCLNAIIISLLYQNSPDDLRFIMVDPKRVELPAYNGIPHLLTPVITEVGKTINALKWCLNEMDRRYEIFAQAGHKKNIVSYNESGRDKMPSVVFIIDELADFMVAARRDVEASVIRLAQMARAVGIHLILATQRPSVDVITGLIKANMPARIAFSVASGIDSRTILDSLGAEKLLGRGDMLFSTADISKPKRLQGAFVSENEIKRVVNYIKDHGGEPQYIEGITERQKVHGIAGVGLDGSGSDEEDELLEEAKELIINSGKASASYLQRRLSVGYARAARLLDLLEEAGVIGPGSGSKPREVLITREQYDSMINQGVSGAPLHQREEAKAPDEFLPESADEDEPDLADEPEAGDEEDEEENEDPSASSGRAEDQEPVGETAISESDDLPAERTKTVSLPDEDDDEGKYFAR